MKTPTHPGAIVREEILPKLGLTVSQASRQLGVSRVTLSRIINERSGVSVEMSLCLESWLGVENGGAAEFWMGMQLSYDLAKARTHFDKTSVTPRKLT